MSKSAYFSKPREVSPDIAAYMEAVADIREGLDEVSEEEAVQEQADEESSSAPTGNYAGDDKTKMASASGQLPIGAHKDYAIVANAEGGAQGFGHNALLVGNDIHGYQFISKEGRDENADGSSNNGSSGGPALNALDIHYPTLAAFMNDPENNEYNRFILISVTHDVGAEMIKDMRREANSGYHILFNNCGNAVENTLRENGYSKLSKFAQPNSSFEMIKKNTNNLYYSR